MNDKRLDILGNVKVSKAIFIQAVPAIIGLVVTALYVMVDSMFVSWLGTDYASAAQVIFPLINLVSAVGFIYGAGGGTFVARLIGQRNFDRANEATSTSLALSAISGLIFCTLVFIFMPQIVVLFGAKTEAIKELAITYGRILMIGSVFQIMNVSYNNTLRSEGSVNLSMKSMIISSLINLVLDPILIFGFDMGIAGAAVATTFSQIVNFILLSRVYSKKKSICRISLSAVKFDKVMLDEIFSIGIPTFFKQALQALSVIILNTLVVQIAGSNGLAAIGNSTKSITIITFIIFGYGQGYQPLAGYCHGAKLHKRLYDATKHALFVSVVFCVTVGLLVVFRGDLLILMFRPTPEVLEIAVDFIKFQAISLILMGPANTISIYFMAIASKKISAFLSVARQGLLFIPIAYILPRVMNYSLLSVYLIQPLADIITIVITLVFFIPQIYKLRKLAVEETVLV